MLLRACKPFTFKKPIIVVYKLFDLLNVNVMSACHCICLHLLCVSAILRLLKKVFIIISF